MWHKFLLQKFIDMRIVIIHYLILIDYTKTHVSGWRVLSYHKFLWVNKKIKNWKQHVLWRKEDEDEKVIKSFRAIFQHQYRMFSEFINFRSVNLPVKLWFLCCGGIPIFLLYNFWILCLFTHVLTMY